MGAFSDLSREEHENPGLAPSLESSGGSRAANADDAPYQHGAFHSSRKGKSQSLAPARLVYHGRGRAGLPVTVWPAATSRVTTLPAPITASSPIETPGRMMAPPPIQTSRPIRTGRPNSSPVRRVSASRGWSAA
jgi:hypothetical protein